MIKNYITYKRNKKIVKREMAKIMANTLPLLTGVFTENERTVTILKYLFSLTPEQIQELVVRAGIDTLPTDDK